MQSTTRTFKFNLPELNLSPADVHRVMGGTDSEGELTRSLCMELFSEIERVEGMRGGYVRFNSVQLQDDSTVNIASQSFGVGTRIAKQLKGIEQAAVFVATAGSRITDWAQQWLQTDPLKGMIADTIASLLPDAIMQHIHKTLSAEVQASGDRLSNAYSPGYCDWSVAEQKKLFALLPEHFCNVTLNEHSMMLPLKSISGVIAIGKRVQYLETICALCERLECAYRRPIEDVRHTI